jgi:5-methylcytosine-specific restriction endonuclease McrA
VYRRVVFARDGGICQICKLPVAREAMHVDHIVPLARGGKHEYANVQLAHARCNISKGARWWPQPVISDAAPVTSL